MLCHPGLWGTFLSFLTMDAQIDGKKLNRTGTVLQHPQGRHENMGRHAGSLWCNMNDSTQKSMAGFSHRGPCPKDQLIFLYLEGPWDLSRGQEEEEGGKG